MHPRPLGDVFPAEADEPDGFHAGVRESSVAGELRQALHSILKGIDGCGEMVLENCCCGDKGTFIFIRTEFRMGITHTPRDDYFCENLRKSRQYL